MLVLLNVLWFQQGKWIHLINSLNAFPGPRTSKRQIQIYCYCCISFDIVLTFLLADDKMAAEPLVISAEPQDKHRQLDSLTNSRRYEMNMNCSIYKSATCV